MPSLVAPPKTGAATGTSGAYTKLGLVGRGSFGAVYLVRHTRSGGEALIMKEVQTRGLSRSEVRATRQEIAVLKHVSHPSVIGYHSMFESDGLVCILMEYAAGGDLARLIAKRAKEGPGGQGARFTETEVRSLPPQCSRDCAREAGMRSSHMGVCVPSTAPTCCETPRARALLV